MGISASRLEIFVDTALAGDIKRLDGEQRRSRIIAATIQECAATGFRDAAMAGIAKRARVSTASLYRDFGTREKLLEVAIIFATPLVAAEFIAPVTATAPRARLIELLIRHCAVFSHPHASWLYRAHVSGELPPDSDILRFGKEARASIESFWKFELRALEKQGAIAVPQLDEAINFLLGAVQRRTLIAMLLFGTDDIAEPDLETAATSAVDWFLNQFGIHERPAIALAP